MLVIAAYRFKPSRAKEIIGGVLVARLSGQQYHADNTSSWAREIADEIKNKLKGRNNRNQVFSCLAGHIWFGHNTVGKKVWHSSFQNDMISPLRDTWRQESMTTEWAVRGLGGMAGATPHVWVPTCRGELEPVQVRGTGVHRGATWGGRPVSPGHTFGVRAWSTGKGEDVLPCHRLPC